MEERRERRGERWTVTTHPSLWLSEQAGAKSTDLGTGEEAAASPQGDFGYILKTSSGDLNRKGPFLWAQAADKHTPMAMKGTFCINQEKGPFWASSPSPVPG